MKNRIFSIVALVLAVVFWFFDSSVHYFVFEEPQFELIPDEINELWMRSTIALLVILFGVFADYFSKKIARAQKQLEAMRIYDSMIYATHHILNNLLNQMQLFRIEALRSKDFDKDVIELYDRAIGEASGLIERLSEIEDISEGSIKASVSPGAGKNLPDHANVNDGKNSAAD